MTQQEKNIKICEALGKCGHPREAIKATEWEDGNDGGTDWVCSICGKDPHFNPCPNYFSCLNACAEMRKMIYVENETAAQAQKRVLFEMLLCDMAEHPLNATAEQHSESFGLTFGLWKEGE